MYIYSVHAWREQVLMSRTWAHHGGQCRRGASWRLDQTWRISDQNFEDPKNVYFSNPDDELEVYEKVMIPRYDGH